MTSLLEIQILVRTARVFTVLCFILVAAVRPNFAQELRYNYDAAGRLLSITDDQGRTITYDYDALGNLLGARRVDTVDQVAISLLNPDSGFIGTQVEIVGKGFSNVLNENAIAFNGVSAPVLAATTTSLTTQVPIGATTGPITVKTPSGSATSPQAFTVLVATINVSPAQATLIRGTSQQFAATITGPNDTRVVWNVDGIEGGNATVGTITPQGLYTAPPHSMNATSSLSVTITASSVAVPGLSASASVTVLPTCTIFWTGAGGNNLWQNAANWNTKVLPGVNDDACIGSGFNVTLSSGNQSIRSFDSDSPLSITTAGLTIAASSTLNHNFTLAGGTLSGTGNLTVSGQATWTSGTMTGTGTTTFNSNATITANGNVQFLSGGRKFNTAGTTTFTGANGEFRTGSSETTNNSGVWLDETAGTTRIGNIFGGSNDQATFNNTGTFRKTGSAVTTIISVFNNSDTVDIQTGSLSFSSGYTQTAGETKLNGGALSSTTTLNIQGGKLTGAGTVTANISNAGQVSPGASPGILNITGTYTQTSTGALNIEIGGLTAGTQFDQFKISGVATLSGTLNVSLINGFVPNPGDTFQIMTFGSRSGIFTTTNAPGFVVNVNATNVIVMAP